MSMKKGFLGLLAFERMLIAGVDLDWSKLFAVRHMYGLSWEVDLLELYRSHLLVGASLVRFLEHLHRGSMGFEV